MVTRISQPRPLKAGTLARRDAVAALLRHRGDALVVSGLGSPTYDVHAAGVINDNYYYLWGAMGAFIGLGPRRPSLDATCWSSPATVSN
ncbi:MAG: hypothetical protein R3D05_14385 [Dongiaceae bacterium]